jgi:hypothetical protein
MKTDPYIFGTDTALIKNQDGWNRAPWRYGRWMMKKAIAYVSEISLNCVNEVISKDYQKRQIIKHAAEEGIEIVAWFEDDNAGPDLMSRPGIKKLLEFNEPYDLVLAERVWALSRNMETLERFFAELDRRAIVFDCATTMWDCTSQKCRHRFYPALRMLHTETKADTGSHRPPETRKPSILAGLFSIFGNRRAAA